MDLNEHKVGQVWKSKRRKPDSVFLITKVEPYKEEHRADQYKITGVLSSCDNHVDPSRSMHESSLRKMFPWIMFDPEDTLAHIYTEDK